MLGGGKPQWTFLQHNGPMFPPEYKPHRKPIIVNGKEIILTPLAEEYATMYAKFLDTDYINNSKFNKNFWLDFKPTITNYDIDNLQSIDFSIIKKYLDEQKQKKLNLTKEEKINIKNKQDKLEQPYKFCIIDGTQQQVGNFKIEPPGIFLGRGDHPKIGRIKKRITYKDVTINLSKDAKIPDGDWGEVINDNSVIWLATWVEEITGKNKYIFTSLDSFFKSKSDEDKFDLAKQLKKKS